MRVGYRDGGSHHKFTSHHSFLYALLGGGGAIPLDCLRSRRSAYWRPGVGIECRPPPSFVGDFLVIGVECLFGGRGMRDGVWPGVLAADRGTTVCDFLGVVNSRTPEAERGRWRLLMLMLPILSSLRSLSES